LLILFNGTDIIIFLKALVEIPETELCLQVFEVDAAAWLTKETVKHALQSATNDDESTTSTFEAYEIANTTADLSNMTLTTIVLKQVVHKVKNLQSVSPDDKDHLSAGCRFALREWLKMLITSFLIWQGTLPLILVFLTSFYSASFIDFRGEE
jgi:hypothetical protein